MTRRFTQRRKKDRRERKEKTARGFHDSSLRSLRSALRLCVKSGPLIIRNRSVPPLASFMLRASG
jgi:hypothetical protein